MEGILELYALNHQTFETREALSLLTQRFNLGRTSRGKSLIPETFKQLLNQYDKKYATVRSYHGIDKSLSYSNQLEEAKSIMFRASIAGNIQAVINGFKLYPGLVNKITLNDALERAAQAGHEPIIDLLLDLGGTNQYDEIFSGAIVGGHINLITGDKYMALSKPMTINLYLESLSSAIYNQQLASLKYLFTLQEYRAVKLNTLIEAAGEVGNLSIIDYLISLGANDYPGLVSGAMLGTHFELALKYLDQVKDGDITLQTESKHFLTKVIQAKRLDMLKLLVKRRFLTQKAINLAYKQVMIENTYPDDITDYLRSMSKHPTLDFPRPRNELKRFIR
jgi:hypothetical protein